ncbi:phage tail terminator family protein [Anaerotignum lactatifermentans]|uniref:phage tail terminator family protein n=1 Tax=Anaerotignum lactatifermentans TaxID=160404 RepID=UPI00266D9D0D|nr:hypothetical protein [Anaerotignum lactatifermentans]
MNYTVETVADSLSNYLKVFLPEFSFYQDPNQQGTKIPCMFLQQRYSNIKLETGGYYLRTIGLDLTCLEEYNLPDLQRRYQKTAEILDLHMETFPYTDGIQTEPVQIRTYDREWDIDLNELHYRFEIRERVRIPKETIKMQTIEKYNEEVVE